MLLKMPGPVSALLSAGAHELRHCHATAMMAVSHGNYHRQYPAIHSSYTVPLWIVGSWGVHASQRPSWFSGRFKLFDIARWNCSLPN